MIKEKIERLVNAYKEDGEVIEMINDTMDGFADYVQSVNQMENTINIMRFKLDAAEYRERLQALDRNRRIIHNGCIAGCKLLNRLSASVGLDKFFEGNIEERLEVAEFAMEVTKEIFDNRTK